MIRRWQICLCMHNVFRSLIALKEVRIIERKNGTTLFGGARCIEPEKSIAPLPILQAALGSVQRTWTTALKLHTQHFRQQKSIRVLAYKVEITDAMEELFLLTM